MLSKLPTRWRLIVWDSWSALVGQCGIFKLSYGLAAGSVGLSAAAGTVVTKNRSHAEP